MSRALSQKSVTALYVKLVYDVIVSWKSYTAVMELPDDVIFCLDRLFDKMETDHGVQDDCYVITVYDIPLQL